MCLKTSRLLCLGQLNKDKEVVGSLLPRTPFGRLQAPAHLLMGDPWAAFSWSRLGSKRPMDEDRPQSASHPLSCGACPACAALASPGRCTRSGEQCAGPG